MYIKMASFIRYKHNTITVMDVLDICISENNKLSFILLSGFDDDENIQQITESIRRHAQRKKAAKVL